MTTINNYWSALLIILLFGVLSCGKEDPMMKEDLDMNEDPMMEEVPEQYGLPFGNVPVIADIHLYEVNPRVFSTSQNLAGITHRLEQIKDLGINMVWLMPIYQTGQLNSVGSPYAVRDYYKIHEDYGTLDDLRTLVDKAHDLDMAVMMDWVANHTAWDNEWIANTSWYTQDENGIIIHPAGTNWMDVAELNYNNMEMRREMIHAMKYWILEANVDGYRCDFASGVPVDFWRQAIDTLRSLPDREIVMFAESGDKPLLDAGFDMIFGWTFYGRLKEVFNGQSASRIWSSHVNEYNDLDIREHIVRWITNHDEHAWDATPQHNFGGEKAAMAAFVLAASYGGVPLVYNGQEVAVPYQLPFFEGNKVFIDWNVNASVKELYTRLLNFRKDNEVFRLGNIDDYSSDDVVVLKKNVEEEEVLIIVNVRNKTFDLYQLPESMHNTTWKDTLTDEEVEIENSIELEPYQFYILEAL